MTHAAVDRDALILNHLPLVQQIARRYSGFSGTALDIEDLVQEGVIGLHRASELYDPAHKTRFSTYATWWVRKAILRAIETRGRPIRLPAHTVDAYRRMRAARERVEAEGRAATLGELAAAAGISIERAVTILQVAEAPLSLDAPMGEEGDRLGELLVAPETADSYDSREIRGLVDQLPEPLRDVILLRFWEEMGMSAVAHSLGLSRQGVMFRQERALKMLREMLGATAPPRPETSTGRQGRTRRNGRLGHAEQQEIFQRHAAGDITQAALGREYGVSRARVHQIVRQHGARL